jgi:L-asparaginase
VTATRNAQGKRLAVVYLGGTIGMVEGAGGLAASAGPADAICEVIRGAVPGAEVVLETPLAPVDSSEIGPKSWGDVTGAVAAAQATADGVLVVHGTDTLAYSSSILALTAGHRPVAVVLTGAQSPLLSQAGAADAAANLFLAARTALSLPGGVWLAFGGLVLPGFGVTKVSAQSPRAFDVPNPRHATCGQDEPGAHADGGEGAGTGPWAGKGGKAALIERLQGFIGRPAERLGAARIPLAAVYPGVDGRSLRGLTRPTGAPLPAGLVLECYGAGTVPASAPGLVAELRSLTDAGAAVVAVSRCLDGEARLDTYAASRALVEAGVCDGRGLTSEAALATLHYLTALGLAQADIQAIFTR